MVNYHARQHWNRRLALGWILVPRFQGQGYMQEAFSGGNGGSGLAVAVERSKGRGRDFSRRSRSARLAQRLGFQYEGLLRDRLLVAGQPRAMQMYALLRSDWRN